MKYICPSLLSADFTKLKEQLELIENAGADILHCDIMDGSFVPNITFGPDIIKQVSKIIKLPLDVHLMIDNPVNFIDRFADAGASYISVHYENNKHLHRVVDKIKSLNIKAGVVINPATSPIVLKEIIPYLDFILVMSVNPGFGGQKFIPTSIDKIKALKSMLLESSSEALIEIDGGVSEENIKLLSNAGADMFVAGASIFNSNDIAAVIKEMKKLIA